MTEPDKHEPEQWYLSNANGRDVTFSGYLLASVSDKQDSGPLSLRYTVLTLYETVGGSFICVSVIRSLADGDTDLTSLRVHDNVERVQDHYGFTALAKRLYSELGWDSALHID